MVTLQALHQSALFESKPLGLLLGRSWVLLRLKDRWVQRLLDQRAKSGPNARALSREVDQVLLPLSSVISWITVVVSVPTDIAGCRAESVSSSAVRVHDIVQC